MLKNFKSLSSNLLQCSKYFVEQQRTTYILRRTREVRVKKFREYYPPLLKRSEYYYEVVENTNRKKKPLLNLVLIKDVPGVGMIGDKIQTKYYFGYNNFLLPKLAVYENSPEAQNIVRQETDKKRSSIYCQSVENFFTEQPLPVFLSSENEWTLEPLHIRVSLRRIGIITHDNCIKLPLKKISGPNPDLENKDFLIKVVMNNSEIFPVRCRIYHFSSKEYENAQSIGVKAINSESEPLFAEEREEIEKLIKAQEELKKKKALFIDLNIL